MDRSIKIQGARQHNLQNIDLEIPKDKFVVITGVSGSGKSSLAFDTIYAEGQRRYVESLSSYARQFLGLMDKPDVDRIDGLSPSISIDQKTVSHNPRSTVGTSTEIYDYFRLLFARIGHPHCPSCGIEISRLSLDEIRDRIITQIKTTTELVKARPFQFSILAPVIRSRKGEFKELLDNLLAKGFSTARIDNQIFDLNSDVHLLKTNKHTIDSVIDTLSVSYKLLEDKVYLSNLRSRLSQALEQALKLSDGLVILQEEESEHLYSEKFSCPNCNLALPELEPRLFSFNSPLGACETCKGLGSIEKIDPSRILNPKLSINEGGVLPFNRIFFHDTWYARLLKTVGEIEGIDLTAPIGKMPAKDLDLMLYGTGKTYRVTGTNHYGRPTSIQEEFTGLIPRLEDHYFNAAGENSRNQIQQYMKEEVCDTCAGAKLKQEILSVTIGGQNIHETTESSITKLLAYLINDLPDKLSDYEKIISESILKEIHTRLSFLDNVGLGYLTLARKSKTLSGGEQQRIRLASQIGTGLTGVLYVLDEPSIGLHSKDVSALIKSLKGLVNLGNTLIVVEHDRETIEAAEHIIELGPLAGQNGGKLVATGTFAQVISNPDSLTGKYLKGKRTIPTKRKPVNSSRGFIQLHGATENNLKDVNVKFPLGNLIGVTGVSGSGKSSLISDTLYPALKYYLSGRFQDKTGEFKKIDGYQYANKVYLVDQSPIGKTPRSNPATYVKFFDDIRDLFANTQEARLRGYKKGRFSFNVKGGRCEKCQGGGSIKIEMQFLPDVYVKCDVCEGKRYNQETLEVKYKGKTIYDILEMTIDEAVTFFLNHPKIFSKVKLLQDVGLGYLHIGQPAPTLSGGESQRIKLANELSRRANGDTIYILDEPTTGLHFYDIEKLLTTLRKLVEKGSTVIVIEHNLDVIKNCSWLVDLGPEGGDEGGRVVFQGNIEDIKQVKESHTAKYLSEYL